MQHLLQPVPFAQFVTIAFLAILFLQSGLDKVIDFTGNHSWLQGHFAKSPLRGQVKFMLISITITEVLTGILALAGAAQLALTQDKTFALYAAQLAAVNVLLLFFGQRMAKEYAGAAVLVSYFVLSVGAVVLLNF